MNDLGRLDRVIMNCRSLIRRHFGKNLSHCELMNDYKGHDFLEIILQFSNPLHSFFDWTTYQIGLFKTQYKTDVNYHCLPATSWRSATALKVRLQMEKITSGIIVQMVFWSPTSIIFASVTQLMSNSFLQKRQTLNV